METSTLTRATEPIRDNRYESGEVKYVHEQFPNLNRAEIVKAVEIAGPFRRDIIEFIKRIHGNSN